MDEEQEEYLASDTLRTEDLIDVCSNMTDADDKMAEVLERLSQVEVVPDVGRYYTFIYRPKTPRIRYDEYPLIACTCLLYTSPSPRDVEESRMPSSA